MGERRPPDRGRYRTGIVLAVVLAVALFVIFSLLDARPSVVYVPVNRQDVALAIRASAARVVVGQPVVLHAQRWNRGEWKQVRARNLAPEDCRMARPPPPDEAEVADNLAWRALPPEGGRFNTDYRADGTRVVVFNRPGTYALYARSTIWCGGDRLVLAGPLEIRVEAEGSAQ